jgi:hypothetical protein
MQIAAESAAPTILISDKESVMRNNIDPYKIPIFIGFFITIVVFFIVWYFYKPKPWKYERECEYPNVFSVG